MARPGPLRYFWYTACSQYGTRVTAMTVATTTGSCIPGCKASVPRELATEHICVQHFMLGIESACSVMRRESALEGANTTRKREIESYVKATALKLSDVATGSTR